MSDPETDFAPDPEAGAEEQESARAEPGLAAENVIWILGHTRTGSTWLGSMMQEQPRTFGWGEPLIGELFGVFYTQKHGDHRGASFVLSPKFRDVWTADIRRLILNGAMARKPRLTLDSFLVIRDPHSSMGARIISDALPESRFIFLIRDPRDMVASALDGHRAGSWTSKNPVLKRAGLEKQSYADEDPDGFVRSRAELVMDHLAEVQAAFEQHRGPKAIVRYEDLRTDPLTTMRRLYRKLDMSVPRRRLEAAVEKHDWDRIPQEDKGPGKRNRKAKPGGWREDLTPEQARAVGEIMAPIIDAYYPLDGGDGALAGDEDDRGAPDATG